MFFMLNSAEHEICSTYKSKLTFKDKYFLAKHTIVGISYLLAQTISCSAKLSMKKVLLPCGQRKYYCIHTKYIYIQTPHILKLEHVHGLLSDVYKKYYETHFVNTD